MLSNSFRRTVVLLSLIGALGLFISPDAFGQALRWQPGIDSVQAAPYYVAQDAAAPGPTPAPPATAPPAAAPPAAAPPAAAAPVAKPPVAKPPVAKPPVAKPPIAAPEPEPTFEPSSLLDSQDPLVRLASVPNMFGDSFGIGGGMAARAFPFQTDFNSVFGSSSSWIQDEPGSDVAPGGAIRRVKIAENNKALPVDRVYFTYNHFDNALAGGSDLGVTRSIDIDQYTMGFEKTFGDRLWSCEVRMPFSGAYAYTSPETGAGTGHFGNLAVTLKRRIYTSDTGVAAAGLGISTPTGSSVFGHVAGTPFSVSNDTVALLPYVGFLTDRFDPFFLQGFLQVDVPLNGNRVVLDNTLLGRYNDQTLMYVDLEMGAWLFRDRPGVLSALAAILEFHYTTTLTDTDVVSGTVGAGQLSVLNINNRVDVVNMTIGLNAQLGELTTLGVGGVVPLDSYPDRLFDGEVQIFLNRMY